jgi:hypothetical protein
MKQVILGGAAAVSVFMLIAVPAVSATAARAIKPAPPAQGNPPGTTLSFNVRAQLAADRIVNADESAISGRAATAARPLAAQYDSSIAFMTITSTALQISVAGHPAPALARAIKDDAGGIPVTIRTVAHSEVQLDSIRDRIKADVDYWAARGIQLSMWGPDLVTDKVRVVLAHYTPSDARAIIARYGAAWVTVSTQSLTIKPSCCSRTDDAEPWFAGDEIEHNFDGETAVCTTGYTLTDGSHTFVTTAAHCLESNYSNNFYQAGGVFGTWYEYSNDVDTVIIGPTSASGAEWADPVTPTRDITAVASTDPIGGVICTDGLTDREVCDVDIKATGQDITYSINGSNTTVSNTVYACQANDKAAFSPGDSGGPAETTIGSTETHARGEILAHTGDSHCGWYYPERYVERDWAMSVVLG